MRVRVLSLILVFGPIAAAWSAEGAASFDGKWKTTVSCPAAAGAMGYAYDFPTTIKDGVLHGERGDAGAPGRLTLDGRVGADGQAELYASGVVGASQFAVGQRPTGTPYGYHVTAHFADGSGTGSRVEGRPCNLTFTRD